MLSPLCLALELAATVTRPWAVGPQCTDPPPTHGAPPSCIPLTALPLCTHGEVQTAFQSLPGHLANSGKPANARRRGSDPRGIVIATPRTHQSPLSLHFSATPANSVPPFRHLTETPNDHKPIGISFHQVGRAPGSQNATHPCMLHLSDHAGAQGCTQGKLVPGLPGSQPERSPSVDQAPAQKTMPLSSRPPSPWAQGQVKPSMLVSLNPAHPSVWP